MLLTAFLAVAVPLSFLYFIHWLDLYGSDRPRVVLACVGWGLVAFILAVIVNRTCIYIVGLPLKFVSTRTAPPVEEAFKAAILVYLLHKGRLTYFVDGAIYGFASGMGFAAIENLRYMQLFPDNTFALIVLRDFSSALAHGTATAMTGIGIGLYALSARGRRQILPVVLGVSGALLLHYLWNIFSWYSPLNRNETEWVLVGVGLTGVALVAATILWGMHRERLQLRQALGMKLHVSEEEASVVQHLSDLDQLLVPIEKRFGKAKCRHVASFLHLEAQLGLYEERLREAIDPVMRTELERQIAQSEAELDAERRNVGVYVMLYVRSIFPQTAWSLWARLTQSLAKPRASRIELWPALARRVGVGTTGANGIYGRVRTACEARAAAAAAHDLHILELPEHLQKYLRWVMAEVHVTASHAALGLGHHEEHAHAILTELVSLGFLHRAEKDGQEGFRARVVAADHHGGITHLWHSLAHRIGQPQLKGTHP